MDVKNVRSNFTTVGKRKSHKVQPSPEINKDEPKPGSENPSREQEDYSGDKRGAAVNYRPVDDNMTHGDAPVIDGENEQVIIEGHGDIYDDHGNKKNLDDPHHNIDLDI